MRGGGAEEDADGHVGVAAEGANYEGELYCGDGAGAGEEEVRFFVVDVVGCAKWEGGMRVGRVGLRHARTGVYGRIEGMLIH